MVLSNSLQPITAAGFLLVSWAAAASAQFTFQTFTLPDAHAMDTGGINNNGDVAGDYYTNGGNQLGYIRANDGTLTTFSIDSLCSSGNGKCIFHVSAINDLGQVAFSFLNPQLGGFIRNADGSLSTIAPPPGYSGIEIFSLNNAGESVVGAVGAGSFTVTQLYLRSPKGIYTAFPPPPAAYNPPTFAMLNNNGLAAGSVEYAGGAGSTAGFVLDLSSNEYRFFDYSVPPNPGCQICQGEVLETTVYGLNDGGTIIGSRNGAVQFDYFIRSADGSNVYYFLPGVPGGDEDNPPSPIQINNADQITGVIVPSENGFIGTPSSDVTPPTVSLMGIVPDPPEQAIFSVVDPVSGIVNVITGQVNCFITVPTFVAGQKTPVIVTATKINPGSASVAIEAGDGVGNITEFDPDFLTIRPEPEPSDSLAGIPSSEHVLQIANGTSGLNRLTVHVNGRDIVVTLRDSDRRTLNLQAWMTLSANNISFSGAGPAGAQASVILNDEQSGDRGTASRSGTATTPLRPR